MSDARQSVEAAESVGAEEHAPVALDSAQQLLSKAEDDMQAGDYEEAQKEALAAREAARQAVTISQAKQEVEMETTAIEEPIIPAIEPTPLAEPEPSFYTVIKNDNLWKISAKNSIYGDPLLWPLILKANPELIRDADLITPNMVLMIEPNPSDNEKDTARQHAKFRGITTRKEKDASYLRQYGLR
jgi:nucleoid-associated protein YgaU